MKIIGKIKNMITLYYLIAVRALRGMGVNESDMCREVRQYWDLEGNLLVENDPCAKEKE